MRNLFPKSSKLCVSLFASRFKFARGITMQYIVIERGMANPASRPYSYKNGT